MPRDVNQRAFAMVQQATKEAPPVDDGKNPAAVALGRLGGLKRAIGAGESAGFKLTNYRNKRSPQMRPKRLFTIAQKELRQSCMDTESIGSFFWTF